MSSMRKNLKVLVYSLNSVGNLNACHGMCEELRDRGHQVIFLLDTELAGRMSRFGFKEWIIVRPPMINEKNPDGEQLKFWHAFVTKYGDTYSLPPIKQLPKFVNLAFTAMFEEQKKLEDQYERAIIEIKPDIIIIDGYICCPPIINSGIPWVWLYSAAPHMFFLDDRIPPFFSGLPYHGDKVEWNEFSEESQKAIQTLLDNVNNHNLSKSGQPLNNLLHPFSPYLNVYMWPQELRYPEIENNDFVKEKKIYAVDCFVRNVPVEKFEIPDKLQNMPGKLIYFSMGSIGCAHKDLMTRLLNILVKSPNRFIVVRGPFQLKLPGDNMWGKEFLPQTSIIPLVDLVISHGGNNTLTETFFYGKKILVLPTFCDQIDNAQRVSECSLGARLNPFTCTENELLETIEQLLANDEMTKKMSEIGQRIRRSKDKQTIATMIENIVTDN